MFYQLQIVQIVMRKYYTTTKGELGCLYIKKTNFTGNNGLVLQQTLREKLTVTVKGEQR